MHWLGIAATAALFVYAWRRLAFAPSLRWKFLLALLGLTAYSNLQAFLMPDELLTPFGVFDMWFRHACFYAGQLFFFIFLNRIIFWASEDRTKAKRHEKIAVVAFLFLATLEWFSPHPAMAHHTVSLLVGDLTPYRVLLYLTDQGIQHIVAILFFILSLAILRSESLYAELLPSYLERRRVIMPFLAANTYFILLHVWEFLFESRHLFPFIPDEAGDYVEYAFFFAGMTFLAFAVRRLARSRSVFVSGSKTHETAV